MPKHVVNNTDTTDAHKSLRALSPQTPKPTPSAPILHDKPPVLVYHPVYVLSPSILPHPSSMSFDLADMYIAAATLVVMSQAKS